MKCLYCTNENMATYGVETKIRFKRIDSRILKIYCCPVCGKELFIERYFDVTDK